MNNLLQGNILLALAAALLWGGGDFSGGMGVKTVGGSTGGALRIVLLSHAISLTALLAIGSLRGNPFPHSPALIWGTVAGVAGGLSLTAFYVALSRGAMGASAAVSGLLAAAIPAAFSILSIGSPGLLRLAGFLVAGGAIWIIAAGPAGASPTDVATNFEAAGTTTLAIAAGIGFGIYFIALNMANSAGPIWAMASARLGSLSICSLLLLALTIKGGKAAAKVQISWLAVRWVFLTALLDTSGNMLFVAATRIGRLDIAAVLASLYPASTILLAAWTLKERPTLQQGLGMLVAAAAVVMITL